METSTVLITAENVENFLFTCNNRRWRSKVSEVSNNFWFSLQIHSKFVDYKPDLTYTLLQHVKNKGTDAMLFHPTNRTVCTAGYTFHRIITYFHLSIWKLHDNWWMFLVSLTWKIHKTYVLNGVWTFGPTHSRTKETRKSMWERWAGETQFPFKNTQLN
jgi:hypothetical protein